MKIILFVCDQCGNIVGTQQVRRDELIVKYLFSQGRTEEWCNDCLDKYEKELRKKNEK